MHLDEGEFVGGKAGFAQHGIGNPDLAHVEQGAPVQGFPALRCAAPERLAEAQEKQVYALGMAAGVGFLASTASISAAAICSVKRRIWANISPMCITLAIWWARPRRGDGLAGEAGLSAWLSRVSMAGMSRPWNTGQASTL